MSRIVQRDLIHSFALPQPQLSVQGVLGPFPDLLLKTRAAAQDRERLEAQPAAVLDFSGFRTVSAGWWFNVGLSISYSQIPARGHVAAHDLVVGVNGY